MYSNNRGDDNLTKPCFVDFPLYSGSCQSYDRESPAEGARGPAGKTQQPRNPRSKSSQIIFQKIVCLVFFIGYLNLYEDATK